MFCNKSSLPQENCTIDKTETKDGYTTDFINNLTLLYLNLQSVLY